MRHVVYALVPLVVYATYLFGICALAVVLASTLGAFVTEYIYNRLTRRDQTVGDSSALITGILLGLTLPPSFPLWMAFMGGLISIILGKMIFGGLGYNPFNPALVGRAFLQTAFPTSITTWTATLHPDRFHAFPHSTWTIPFLTPVVDGMSGATPLSAFKFEKTVTGVQDLFLGGVTGSLGETSAVLILLCGIYLAVRKFLDWRIPVGVLAGAGLLAAILHGVSPIYPSALFTIFSGGLMLGAVFMATDMVSSPVTPLAVWIYSAFIGCLVVVIRIWGGLPEGVMYVILLANAITPLLNRWMRPRVYGTGRKP
jgi:electron transport complex protein RnfD